MRLVALPLVAACGRIGFDTGGGDGTIDAYRRPSGQASQALADTYLSGNSPASNFGAAEALELTATTSVLLRFIPTQEGFPLRAWLQLAVLDPSDGTLQIHRVLESWTEGAETGAAGIANWTERGTDLGWALPGARGAARNATIDGEGTPASGMLVMPLDVAVVNSWRDAPATNFGLVIELVGTSDGAVIASREHASQALQPLLIVEVVKTNP